MTQRAFRSLPVPPLSTSRSSAGLCPSRLRSFLQLRSIHTDTRLLLGGIASCSASDYAYSYTFLHSVVCLSFVCHPSHPSCNRSMDIYAIWQVNLWEPLTHCVRWGPWTPGKGRFGGRTPSQSQSMQLQLSAATWRIQTRICDYAFYHITFVLISHSRNQLNATFVQAPSHCFMTC